QQQREEQQAQEIAKSLTEKYMPKLKAAGLERLTILKEEDTRAGFAWLCEDSETQPYKFDGVRMALGSLASAWARDLAKQGIEFTERDIRVEEAGGAHLFRIYFSTKGVFKRVIEYPLDRPISSILDPLNIGVYEDGSELLLRLPANGVMLGATGSGKSVLASNRIAESPRTSDASLWIGARNKLVPLVIPWLLPWLKGQTQRPVIDYVAVQDPLSITEMMAEFYRV